ncbi:MAG: 50S ribosomal protein L4 [Candidatus Sungbacteria bacterium RIFCSPLOWO2_01_FULL_54_21]|uniref:Large ribosomal subunit protein uL4 n=2 Tax=Candidatus Sungiibacteriota TaxID=1817917 RepID=A0A1G2LBI4_9BACT|nr:MAG: 50S ribosomal protein L4 [Candidatus Sungbacteria bacterium RIFCSPHIGHO2_01_FULL_54_26]OHA02784.1 MAG: 50S ribosomal protein L4 [Candidatus Sungbacteria bacterium RIFCSPHIGHO2_02_FULL_53_17]OHA08191.1 MAG: 50S ribosomal protein L4 [Candidatus Sungbacteria bacterium RIFCSPLOWO2_01_FULL_54_21]
MQVKVYNQLGEEAGIAELPEAVFGVKWNADLVHQVAVSYAANRRAGTAHARGRGDVRGGGKKPWRQKGTGRARHGSIRSPIWKGGGVTHGPQKEKVYEKKINKKMARRALWSVLSAKARDREILVIDDVKFPEAKTKAAAVMFRKFSGREEFSNIEKGNGVLVLLSGKDTAARRALRNLPYAGVEEARNLNMHTALQYRYILFPKSALETLK